MRENIIQELNDTNSLASIQVSLTSAFEESNKQLQGWRYHFNGIYPNNYIVNKGLFLFCVALAGNCAMNYNASSKNLTSEIIEIQEQNEKLIKENNLLFLEIITAQQSTFNFEKNLSLIESKLKELFKIPQRAVEAISNKTEEDAQA